jgi:phosphoribosyl 1,2-cyclic phosphodiesterase
MSNIELSSSPNDLNENFLVRFWGVRGLIPSPCQDNIRYGGNTACVEVQVGGKYLIFDGGTGLRMLGKSWAQLPQPIESHLFFTNVQSNRIQGFPFFAPAFNPKNSLHIYGTAASNGASIKQSLCDQMLQPHFPYPLQVMESQLNFHNFITGYTVELDDVSITTALINQTQKSVGYRVDWQEDSFAYATDIHGFVDDSEQERIAQFLQGVDLLITNPSYPPPKFDKSDAGDFNYQTAVSLAQQAGVKQLVISHHHPDDRDDFLDRVQGEIKANFPQVVLAAEGMDLSVG